jgi:predicted transcriptional regulator YheO
MAADDRDFVDALGEMLEYILSMQPDIEPDACAEWFKHQVRTHYDGERVTVRKSTMREQTRAETRARVRAEYNGRNINEITARYNISRRTVYNYLK